MGRREPGARRTAWSWHDEVADGVDRRLSPIAGRHRGLIEPCGQVVDHGLDLTGEERLELGAHVGSTFVGQPAAVPRQRANSSNSRRLKARISRKTRSAILATVDVAAEGPVTNSLKVLKPPSNCRTRSTISVESAAIVTSAGPRHVVGIRLPGGHRPDGF